MGIKELEDFLYQETDSEQWHLKHEGELSHFYNKLEKVAFDSGEYYCFDFCNTLKTDTIGIVRESRYTTIPAHFHKDMELNYIYSGSCTFVIKGKEITMKQGDLCILDSNVIHSAVSYKEYGDIVINIIFQHEFFDHLFLSKLSQKGIISSFFLDVISKNRAHNQYLIFQTQENFKIHSLIQFLLCEYFSPSQCYHELMQAYSAALFIELINTMYDSEKYRLSKKNQLFSILKYIETHYKNCSLTEIASHFGYSPNYLSNYLKEKTGKSFIEIKISQQMAESTFLLIHSEHTINEIAETVGCNNITYFYNKFYDTYQCTPREYRLKYRQMQEEIP